MKFTDIEEYMKKDREERRSHLKLDESCLEIGGDSRQFRSHLAFHLSTTLPKGHKILLCHACNNDKCANPVHHYWGSPRDNVYDQIENGTHTSIWNRSVAKHGLQKAKNIQSEAAKKGGKAGGGHNKLEQSEVDLRRKLIVECHPEKYGWVARASNVLGISHTHVRRLVEQEMPDLKTYKRKMCNLDSDIL